MYVSLPKYTEIFRVMHTARTWADLISGTGAFFSSGGRYNHPHQRTVYAAEDPLVAITEYAFHEGRRWQDSIAMGTVPPFGSGSPPPLISNHQLWHFRLDSPLTLINVEHETALLTFGHQCYSILNPATEYSATQNLANQIRHYTSPPVHLDMPNGISAPSARMAGIGRYHPRQLALFVPVANRIGATLLNTWKLELEYLDVRSKPVTLHTRRIDWRRPRFRVKGNKTLTGFTGGPGPRSLRRNQWHKLTVEYP